MAKEIYFVELHVHAKTSAFIGIQEEEQKKLVALVKGLAKVVVRGQYYVELLVTTTPDGRLPVTSSPIGHQNRPP